MSTYHKSIYICSIWYFLFCEKPNKIFLIFSPVTYAWYGGKQLSQDTIFSNLLVTREEYEEEGPSACFEKFDV